MTTQMPTVAILGASGLIGHSVATDLSEQGIVVRPIARHVSDAQRSAFEDRLIETAVVDLDVKELTTLLAELKADILVNCIGILQSGLRDTAENVHVAFMERLLVAIRTSQRDVVLVQVSVPGETDEDQTEFGRTKRQAERLIGQSGVSYVILRPGFVIAPNAFGGSALIRALAALPFGLPDTLGRRPLAVTAVSDISGTIAHLAREWSLGRRGWQDVWDVMEWPPSTLTDVVGQFRHHFGGLSPMVALPVWLMKLGALAADLAGLLGWSSPIRSTALRELQRGIEGKPEAWMSATGIVPRSLQSSLALVPSTIQERWFGRLYLAKALIIGGLALFWLASGFIAISAGYGPASAEAIKSGIPSAFAAPLVGLTCALDVFVGSLIAYRKSCRIGLVMGLAVSLLYMAGATVLAPALWVDPLGPLVKVFPSMILTIVALAILDNR